MAVTEVVRGFRIPKFPSFSAKLIEQGMDYVPHDGDIIISSFPKTGTNWLQYIVFQIVFKGEVFPNFKESIRVLAPFLGQTETTALESLKKPRMYRHHFSYNMVQKNEKAKCIYIYRHPEDTIISYYHFFRSLGIEIENLDMFFEDFIAGNVGFGNYFDHVSSFYAHKDNGNVLLVSYEKLLLNKREEILRIAEYLGEDYFRFLSDNDSLMKKILERTSFDYMKQNLCFLPPGGKDEERKVDFFRKGVAGDGKQALNPDQLKRLKDLAMKRLEGTDLLKEWYGE